MGMATSRFASSVPCSKQRAATGQGWRGFGPGGSTEPYDVHENPRDEWQKLDDNEKPEELEGADQEQRLLEAGSDTTKGKDEGIAQQARRLWMMTGLGLLGLIGAVSALVALDAQRSQPEKPPSTATSGEALVRSGQ